MNFRMNHCANQSLNRDTMQTLLDVPHRKHPAIQLYLQAHERTQHMGPGQDCCILLRFDRDCDKRRYNLPGAASTEIAVIIPGDGDDQKDPQDIILHRRGGGYQ
jgi:hypothetical protein